MSATRTQIYLTEVQRQRIDRMTASEGIPMAEVIRRALDEYLGDESDASAVLSSTFGAVPAASAPPREDWKRG